MRMQKGLIPEARASIFDCWAEAMLVRRRTPELDVVGPIPTGPSSPQLR